MLRCIAGLGVVLGMWVLGVSFAGADEGEYRISNGVLSVAYDPEGSVLEIGDFAVMQVAAKSANVVQDSLLLEGVEIQPGVLAAVEIRVEKDLPWAVFMVSLHASQETVVKQLTFPEIRLSEHWVPTKMAALGTAGLRAVDGHKGSYMFLAVAHPQTREGVVAGWVTSELGSGIVQSGKRDTQVTLTAFEEFGRLPLAADGGRECDWFVIGRFADARLGLEAYADFVAKVHNITMKPCPTGYCTWYSNKNGKAGSEASTREFAEMAAKKLVPWGMNFFQIDDCWQLGTKKNGPKKNFTAADPAGPYPNGMKVTADDLVAHGLTAGLWFMPFSGNYNDPYYADKQEWFVKSKIDYPAPGEKSTRKFDRVKQKKGAPYETFWGGTCLDMTDCAVKAYVKEEVSRIAKDWGYKYFKIDGTWTAMAVEQLYVNDEYLPDDIGLQDFDDETMTNVEVFRDAWRQVRSAAGDDVFLMSCNISQNMRTMGGNYGLVDAVRIGPDNGASWEGICAGPVRGTARYFFNGRVWWNDPDPVYVRDSIPLSRAQWITSWVALTGQLYAFSDWLPELSDERVNVLRRTMPNHQRTNVRPVDLFHSELANVWLLSEGNYHILGLFNWKEKEETKIDYAMDFVGFDANRKYVAFDFWENRLVPEFSGRLTQTLPGGVCRILAVREVTGNPMLLSTSRHVASPILDVTDEVWNGSEKTLSGKSETVAGEAYELRIYAAESSIPTVEISGGEQAEVTREGNLIRVKFIPKSVNVSWKVTF
ncbi:MAG: hypothetical protein Q4D98_01870 [Planctomycetia bacterium]|nr:hypothetical protein [Planctomycetia bacterium]